MLAESSCVLCDVLISGLYYGVLTFNTYRKLQSTPWRSKRIKIKPRKVRPPMLRKTSEKWSIYLSNLAIFTQFCGW